MNFDRLKDYVDKMIKEYNAPGVDCIVCKDHQVLFRYCAGMSDIENKKPLNENNLYFIFSMTKMLTCTAALQLMEKGKFLLNDPVSMYLPSFSEMKITSEEYDAFLSRLIANGNDLNALKKAEVSGVANNPITIKDLFTMSAGLDYNLEAEGIKKAISEGKTSTLDIVNAIAETTLSFEPGTRFRYSLCHDVLGGLIEVWSEQKFGDYLRENVLEPLGMKNTFFGTPEDEEVLSRMTARYMYDEKGIPVLQPFGCRYNLTKEYESGGAGLVSCTEDYSLFLDALACGGLGKSGKRILSPQSIELMSTNFLEGKQLEDFYKMRPGYGYGLGVRTHHNKLVSGCLSPLQEFGWDGAPGGFTMVDTKNKLSLTVFQLVHLWPHRYHTEMRNVLYSCFEGELEL